MRINHTAQHTLMFGDQWSWDSLLKVCNDNLGNINHDGASSGIKRPRLVVQDAQCAQALADRGDKRNAAIE